MFVLKVGGCVLDGNCCMVCEAPCDSAGNRYHDVPADFDFHASSFTKAVVNFELGIEAYLSYLQSCENEA